MNVDILLNKEGNKEQIDEYALVHWTLEEHIVLPSMLEATLW